MPRVGHFWYQIILNTHSSWLPGDKRGFRSRQGHIHSSGDYRNPPPADEHASFRTYQQQQSGRPVRIPPELRPIICTRLIEKIESQNYRLLAVAIDSLHAHLLVELPRDRKTIKRTVGSWKQATSHAVRQELPGKLWSAGCDPEVMKDKQHQQNTFRYILKHADRGAVTWRFDQNLF